MATTYDWWMPIGTGGKYVYCSAVQDFIASTTYNLQEIQLKLAKDANQQPTTGTIYLYLADESHDPIGAALLTIGSITDADLTITYTWKTFAGLDYTIIKDTRYAIVMVISGDAVCVSADASDNCIIKWQGKNGYADGVGQHKQCALNGEWACQITWLGALLDFSFRSMGQELPGKPTNPDPTHEEAGVLLDKAKLDWDASDPTANTYNVYFGEQGSAVLVSSAQTETEWNIPFEILEGNKTYEWRIDATNAAGTITGNTWTFDTTGNKPEKAITPSPTHEASNVTLDETPLSWVDGGGATSFDVYFGKQGSMVQVAFLQAGVEWIIDFGTLDYEKTYKWRIDSVNNNGTTTGTVWEFSSIVFAPPLPGASGGAGGGGGGGGIGEELSPTGENNMITLRRLVVAVENKIFYEDI